MMFYTSIALNLRMYISALILFVLAVSYSCQTNSFGWAAAFLMMPQCRHVRRAALGAQHTIAAQQATSDSELIVDLTLSSMASRLYVTLQLSFFFARTYRQDLRFFQCAQSIVWIHYLFKQEQFQLCYALTILDRRSLVRP